METNLIGSVALLANFIKNKLSYVYQLIVEHTVLVYTDIKYVVDNMNTNYKKEEYSFFICKINNYDSRFITQGQQGSKIFFFV